MNEKAAYPFSEFLERFGVGRTKAYEEIKAGRLKARKSGSRTIILASDAQAWLDGLPALHSQPPGSRGDCPATAPRAYGHD